MKGLRYLSVKKLLQELIESNDNDKTMTEKQLNIICAAIELFSEKGFAATSTSEIAKKAGVAEGTIFRHYKTKKDLLLAIPDYLSRLSISKVFLQNIEKIFEQPDVKFEDFLRALITNRRDFAASNIIIIKVVFQELPFQPELRAEISKSIMLPAKEKLVKVIDRFKERGQINNLPSGILVNFLITTIFGYMFSCYIAQLELGWDHEKDTENLIQYIMNGMCTTELT